MISRRGCFEGWRPGLLVVARLWLLSVAGLLAVAGLLRVAAVFVVGIVA